MEGKMDETELICPRPNETHLKILKIFGHNSFKCDQWKIIRAIIYDKKDSFIVAGTGFGKSLIYQFPPVFLKQTAIIISPLISLMEDQVLSMQRKGIKACLLGPVQKNSNINLKKIQIIYLTPEYFNEAEGRKKLESIQDQICLVAIDECHCITQWGSDFRPHFRKLSTFKSFMPSIPIVCLTATATDHCQNDVVTTLGLRNPLIVKVHLDRPNLEFIAIHRGNSFVDDVKTYLSDIKIGSAIIYVLRRNDAEQFSEALQREGFACKPYHAGMKNSDRHEVLKNFSEGKLRFVVATIAFGMGIDRSDVRIVIHYGSPKNLESYYQESGRAGRDGAPSKCVIFWDEKNFNFHRYWLNRMRNLVYKAHCENLLQNMKNFLISDNCRRLEILRYFDPSISPLIIRESCCDNCLKTLHDQVPLRKMYKGIDCEGKLNISNDSRVLLQLVKSYKGKCDERKMFKFLMGKIPEQQNPNHPLELFGKGKSKLEAWWVKLLSILIQRKMIVRRVEVQLIRVDDDLEEILVRRDDHLSITKKGLKLLCRKTLKVKTEQTKDIFAYLEKTNKEYFIENEEVKSKLRGSKATDTMKKKVNEKEIAPVELFKFEVKASSSKKLSPKEMREETINYGASCSKTVAEIKETESSDESDLEDDEYLENIAMNYKMTRKPLNVELGDLLNYLDNFYCQNLKTLFHQPTEEIPPETQNVLQNDSNFQDEELSPKITLKRSAIQENSVIPEKNIRFSN